MIDFTIICRDDTTGKTRIITGRALGIETGTESSDEREHFDFVVDKYDMMRDYQPYIKIKPDGQYTIGRDV